MVASSSLIRWHRLCCTLALHGLRLFLKHWNNFGRTLLFASNERPVIELRRILTWVNHWTVAALCWRLALCYMRCSILFYLCCVLLWDLLSSVFYSVCLCLSVWRQKKTENATTLLSPGIIREIFGMVMIDHEGVHKTLELDFSFNTLNFLDWPINFWFTFNMW